MNNLLSKNNPLIKHLAKLVSSSSYRYTAKTTIVVGNTLIKELYNIVLIKTLLSLQENSLPIQNSFLTTKDIIKKITQLPCCQGPIAEIAIPQFKDISNKKCIAILDEISDPGNLGTILRSALAFGIEGVHLTKNCCDPFNDKVNRSAKGANFILPISYEPFTSLDTSSFHLLLADVTGTCCKKIAMPKKPIALVLSNETRGLNPSWKGEKITIHTSSQTDSLNVSIAASIIFYELANQL